MKIIKIALAVLAFAAGGWGAQVAAQTAVEVEQRAAVKELLDAMNYKQMLSQFSAPMMRQVMEMSDQMIETSASRSKLTAEQKAEARNAARLATAKSSKAMVDIYNDPKIVEAFEDIMARAYAKNFTIAEIKATTAFYTSAAGRKTLTIMPKMMQEAMPEIMAVIAPRMSAIMEETTRDVAAQIEKSTAAESPPPKK